MNEHEGVVPVEYIQSTGTQYIDTRVFFDDATHTYSWDVIAQVINTETTEYRWFCGWFYNGAYSCGTYGDKVLQYSYYPFGRYYIDGVSIGDGMSAESKYDVVENIAVFKNKSIPISLILFGRRTTNGISISGSIKIFGFSAYDNGELVIDLVPVRVGHVGYMLDTISGELFGNEGIGSFIVGPDKE